MHYKDGTEAKVGDLVKGTAYNTKDAKGQPRVIVGTMLQITPGSDTCNCVVGFVEHEPATVDNMMKRASYGESVVARRLNDGPVFVVAKTDYSECKAFELVHRPEA